MFTRALFIKKLLTFSWFTLLGYAAFINPLYANPENGVVISGNATINQSSGYTQINQTTDKAIINWQGFSIDANEHTHFQQPNSSSITLNRVTGNQASKIMGKLSANGKVMLLNPSGIIFGPNSRVDVAGLIATTANINDNDFLAGKFNFIQNPANNAGIVNEGAITVAERGLVALVAPSVQNNGKIVANLGKVTLAAGTQFTVDLQGDETIQFAANSKVTQQTLTPDGQLMKNAVGNSGQIYANGGQVVLTAQAAENIVENAVNMDGIIEAKSMGTQNGKVVIYGGNEGVTLVSGKIDVSGLNDNETGGSVKVLGHNVGLMTGTQINASGKNGGGTVLIGGDYLGSGTTPRAQATYVAKDTTINADAIKNGNGGKVIVWADQYTWFHGNISAKGGAEGGNGGFVETSGKVWLDIGGGRVKASAAAGNNGIWLLDPTDVIITDNPSYGGAPPALEDNGDGELIFRPHLGPWIPNVSNSSTSNIDAADIIAGLNNGTDVVITTNSGFEGNGDITVDAHITKTTAGAASLTLNAANNIYIKKNITTTGGPLSITLNAKDINQQYASGSFGLILVSPGVDIITRGGSVTFNTPNWTEVFGTVRIDTGTSGSAGGAVVFNGDVVTAGSPSTNYNLDIRASTGADITFNGAVGDLSVPFNVIDVSGRNITFNSNVGIDTLNVTATTFTANGALVESGTNPGNANITANTINFNNNVIVDNLVLNGNNSGILKIANGLSTRKFVPNGFTQIQLAGTLLARDPILLSTPISLIGDTHIDSSNGGNIIDIEGAITGNGHDLTISTAASTSNGGNVGLGAINGVQDLIINADGDIYFRNDIGATAPITNLTTNGRSTAGFTILGGNITGQNGALTFNTPVVIVNNITLGANSGQTQSVIFNHELISNNHTLTINRTPVLTFHSVGEAANLALAGLNINNATTINLNGRIVTASAVNSTGDATTVNVNNSAATIALAHSLVAANGNINLNDNANAYNEDVSFTKAINLTATSATLKSFTTNSALSLRGNFTVNGGNFVLPANNTTTLTGDTRITATAGNGIIIGANNAFSGNYNLIFDAPNVTLNSSLNTSNTRLASFTYDSTAPIGSGLSLGGSIFVNNNIVFSKAATLTNDSFLSSNGGLISISNIEDSNVGQHGLILNTAGVTRLNGNIGSNTALSVLVTDDGGNTEVSGNITTVNDILLNDAITLKTNNLTLTSTGGKIFFASSLAGAGLAVTMNAADTLILNGAVGGNTSGTALSIFNAGMSNNINLSNTINANTITGNANTVRLTSTQAKISQGALLAAVGGTVDIAGGTYNEYVSIGKNIKLVAPATIASTPVIVTSFTNTSPFSIQGDWSTNGNGAINFADNYQVTLTGDTRLATGTGNLTLMGSITGDYLLTLNSSGNTILDDNHTVGGIITDAGGTTRVSGTVNTSSGDIIFNDAVHLIADSTIISNGNIIFGDTIDGSNLNLSLSADTIDFNGQVGGNGDLSSLIITSANVVNLNHELNATLVTGNATTVNVNDPSALLAHGGKIVATGGTLNVVAGAYNEDVLFEKSFNLVNNGTVTVNSLTNNEILGIRGIWIANAGDFQINGGLNLSGDTTLQSSNGNINLTNAINGNHAFTTNASGITTITGDIGDSSPVASFTATSDLIKLGANISVQGNTVTFNAPVELINNSSVTDTGSTGIQFNSTVDGAYQLALNATNGDIHFADTVGGNQAIQSLIIQNADNVSPQKAINVINFEQHNGQGLTDLSNNLIAQNDVNINTNELIGNITANNAILTSTEAMRATVDIFSSLTVGGQRGGELNGKVMGYAGELASLLVHLASGAKGDFVFNGCLLPGGCTATSTDYLPQQHYNVEEFTIDTLACTVASSNNPDGSSDCANKIEFSDEDLEEGQAL